MNRPRQTPLKRIEQYLQDYTIRKKIRFYMSTVFCVFLCRYCLIYGLPIFRWEAVKPLYEKYCKNHMDLLDKIIHTF